MIGTLEGEFAVVTHLSDAGVSTSGDYAARKRLKGLVALAEI